MAGGAAGGGGGGTERADDTDDWLRVCDGKDCPMAAAAAAAAGAGVGLEDAIGAAGGIGRDDAAAAGTGRAAGVVFLVPFVSLEGLPDGPPGRISLPPVKGLAATGFPRGLGRDTELGGSPWLVWMAPLL